MMVFTSGSTALPKAAMLTHGGIARNARAHSARLRMTEADRWCTGMPFFHVGGTIWGLGGCAAVGACVVYLPAFDGAQVLQTIERHRCTINFGVETMLRDELAVADFARYDLSSLRISSAGAPFDLRREVRLRFGVPTILSMYGMTEAHANVAVTGPDDSVEQQDRTMGRPHAEVSVAIADPLTGQRLRPGEEGEIVLKGRGMFAGYYGQPDETAALFDADGWLRSGDLGIVDRDGYLTFRGRSKEMIRVGGENVSLLEVETIVMRHPAIERAYAIGVPDDRLVETVAIFARQRPGGKLTPESLRAYCAAQMALYKVPRHIFFVDEFPQGEAGRVSKARLREGALNTLGRAGA
jgi:acyl-CoA synthetase (AMP-forming)/AMP-acid ligase II